MSTRTIPTRDLRAADLPGSRAGWRRIVAFAATLDPQAEGAAAARAPRGVLDVDERATILELRLALYTEWRRWNHRGEDPDPETLRRAWHVLELLRERVSGSP